MVPNLFDAGKASATPHFGAVKRGPTKACGSCAQLDWGFIASNPFRRNKRA